MSKLQLELMQKAATEESEVSKDDITQSHDVVETQVDQSDHDQVIY